MHDHNVLLTLQGVKECVGRVRGAAVLAPMQGAPPTPLSALSGDIARKIRIFLFEVISFIFNVQCSTYTPGGGECGPGFT